MTSMPSIMLMALWAIKSLEDELDCSILLELAGSLSLELASEMLLELGSFASDELRGGVASEELLFETLETEFSRLLSEPLLG